MAFRQYLDLIWELMCAYLVRLEQVDCIDLRIHMEVPSAKHVIFETVYGLVSLD